MQFVLLNILIILLSSADLFHFVSQIILSGTLTECQTFWIQIRTNILSVWIPVRSDKIPPSWSGSKLFAKVNNIWHQAKVLLTVREEWLIYFFVRFVSLRPKLTAMVMAGQSVHQTTLFSWASLKNQLTSTLCTYFRL